MNKIMMIYETYNIYVSFKVISFGISFAGVWSM